MLKDKPVPRNIIVPFILACVSLLTCAPDALAASDVHACQLAGQSLHYLAFGDSITAGDQSSAKPYSKKNQFKINGIHGGYVNDLFTALKSQGFVDDKDLACPLGETSTTFLKGGDLCTKKGDPSQLDTALNYINQGNVGLVTLTIGAGDVLNDIKISPGPICQLNQTGFKEHLKTLDSNLQQIVKPLHDALNGNGQLLLLNYYDPFQNLCPETVPFLQQFNSHLAAAIKPYGTLVDIFSAFGGAVVKNKKLCTYTGICKNTINTAMDIQPTAKGYQVIADTIKKVGLQNNSPSTVKVN